MPSKTVFFCLSTLVFVAVLFGLAVSAHAQTETVIHTFDGADGYNPIAGLVRDSAGNLYGTTFDGGTRNAGTVFELTPTANGWKESVIYNFSGDDGAGPMAGLIFDAAGNLYGTTASGGNLGSYYCHGVGCGEVFRLSRGSTGVWQITPLYQFIGFADGDQPQAGVVFDSAGNLYGTTVADGLSTCFVQFNGCGVVFKLTPPAPNRPWMETVIHSFTGGSDGENPAAGLLIDAAGNLYGTNMYGGFGCTYGCGVAFELSPTSTGAWNFSVLHSFAGLMDGAFPSAALISDSAGNLYGTTVRSGFANCVYFGSGGCGTIFELSLTKSGHWKDTTLYEFTGGLDGALPLAPLVLDSAGNLFGTTGYGGTKVVKGGACAQDGQGGCGVVFELQPTSGSWELTTLFIFDGRYDGGSPTAGLVLDSAGNLYGTTTGNSTGTGVVFKVTP
jgi:uncharacterized repeat protein (TIGR03803 family)